MSKSAKTYQEPTHDEIAACALRIYESEGRPEGKQMQHWLQAETQLIAERKAQAGHIAGKSSSGQAPQTSKAGWQAPASRQNLLHNDGVRANK